MPGYHPGSHRQLSRRARCLNAASEQFSPPSDAAAPLIRATRLSLAVKVDRGEVSPEDAGAELARVAFEAYQEQQRTGAAVTAAHGMEMQGTASMMRALTPPPSPPPALTPPPSPPPVVYPPPAVGRKRSSEALV